MNGTPRRAITARRRDHPRRRVLRSARRGVRTAWERTTESESSDRQPAQPLKPRVAAGCAAHIPEVAVGGVAAVVSTQAAMVAVMTISTPAHTLRGAIRAARATAALPVAASAAAAAVSERALSAALVGLASRGRCDKLTITAAAAEDIAVRVAAAASRVMPPPVRRVVGRSTHLQRCVPLLLRVVGLLDGPHAMLTVWQRRELRWHDTTHGRFGQPRQPTGCARRRCSPRWRDTTHGRSGTP